MLEIPPFDLSCIGLSFSAGVIVGEEALTQLRETIGTKDADLHVRRVRYGAATNGRRFQISERFGMDPDAQFADSGAKRGGMHFEVELLQVAEDASDEDFVDEAGSVEGFWKWLGQLRGIDVTVSATIAYDAASHNCVVNLPLRFPGNTGVFDVIPGLVLAKLETGNQNRMLYEMLVRKTEKRLTVQPYFRRAVEGAEKLLIDVMQRAKELAALAVEPVEGKV